MGQIPEQDCEYDHGQKRLQNRPGCAQQGLLVTHFNVTPCQEVEEVAMPPKIANLESRPFAPALDRKHRLRRQIEMVGDRQGLGFTHDRTPHSSLKYSTSKIR